MQLLLSDEGGILSTLLGLQTGSAPRVYRQGHGMEKTSHPPPLLPSPLDRQTQRLQKDGRNSHLDDSIVGIHWAQHVGMLF